jgi:hypothetical protein
MSLASCAVSAFMAFGFLTVAACARHVAPSPSVVEAHPEGSFARIDVRAGVRVDVHEGRAVRVVVTNDDVAARVTTRVENGTLVVELDEQACSDGCDGGDAHLDVDIPQLDGVTIEGSGNVYVDGASKRDAVDLRIQGSGDLHYAAAGGVVTCSIEGSGDLFLRGEGELRASVAGSGDIDARAFVAHGASVDIDGSGDVSADLHGSARVHISGSGTLRYSGDATFPALEISGSGAVAKL